MKKEKLLNKIGDIVTIGDNNYVVYEVDYESKIPKITNAGWVENGRIKNLMKEGQQTGVDVTRN